MGPWEESDVIKCVLFDTGPVVLPEKVVPTVWESAIPGSSGQNMGVKKRLLVPCPLQMRVFSIKATTALYSHLLVRIHSEPVQRSYVLDCSDFLSIPGCTASCIFLDSWRPGFISIAVTKYPDRKQLSLFQLTVPD